MFSVRISELHVIGLCVPREKNRTSDDNGICSGMPRNEQWMKEMNSSLMNVM